MTFGIPIQANPTTTNMNKTQNAMNSYDHMSKFELGLDLFSVFRISAANARTDICSTSDYTAERKTNTNVNTVTHVTHVTVTCNMYVGRD